MWHPRVEVHFDTFEKQTHAARLGMWVFLSSEVLFFGALFALYGAYRWMYVDAFRQAGAHTNIWLGTINTLVLVSSSFVVAMSLHAARADRPRRTACLLWLAVALGLVFLALKAVEYGSHLGEGLAPGAYYHYRGELPADGARIFFTLYYFLTGLHALHVLGGILLLGWLSWWAWRGAFGPAGDTPLEVGGLYWHFVDIVWLFLWPMFYLLR